VFERGEVTLGEWIPSTARLHAIADERNTRILTQIFPGARLNITAVYGGPQRRCKGRFKEFEVYEEIELLYGLETKKMHLYGDLLRAMLHDQLRWIADRTHQRVISEQNGYRSLAMATRADELAHAPALLSSK